GAAEALVGEAGGAGDATEPDGPVRARRYPFLAAGFALILPGGAHLYARRPWSALVVAVGAVGCLIVIVAARSLLMFQVSVAILIAIVALDAIGGAREARTEIEGWSPARGAQLAAGFQIL